MKPGVGVALLAAVGVVGCGDTTNTTIEVQKPAAAASSLYRVPSGSMELTLKIGATVTVEPGSPPAVGDIVVFHPPEGAVQEICGPTPHMIKVGGAACSAPVPEVSNVKFIKRVVAGPGDVIKIVEGHVIRNGKPESDSYIRPCPGIPECDFPTPITIPADHWFLMGDNRGESDDSRFWGPVPTEWIIGTAH